MDVITTTMNAPVEGLSPTTVKQSLQAVASVLALIGVIAIIALVLGALAYSVTGNVTARRDLFFYTVSQNPIRTPDGNTGAVLYSKAINTTIQPGERVDLASISLNLNTVGTNRPVNSKPMSLVVSAALPSSVPLTPSTQARANVSFVGHQNTIVLSSSVPSSDTVIVFVFGDVANGQSNTVTVTNTSATPVFISQLRILAGSVV